MKLRHQAWSKLSREERDGAADSAESDKGTGRRVYRRPSLVALGEPVQRLLVDSYALRCYQEKYR